MSAPNTRTAGMVLHDSAVSARTLKSGEPPSIS